MQNWDAMQPAANYDQHNAWYNSMFAATIKQEPGTTNSSNHNSPMQSPTGGQMEQYFKQHQTTTQAMDTTASMPMAMTPSPSNNDNSVQHFFDATAAGNMQQQFLQQQQYQQHFQQAQHAAAQNHTTSSHLALGFNPLTPPGLPNAVLPGHFYSNMTGCPGQQQTTSPTPAASQVGAAMSQHMEKLQAALTPRNTPPMDVTPPKSPRASADVVAIDDEKEKDQDLISNSSEDMKYMIESEDDETLRMPIYNSHGKMKNYKCKTCGMVAITKIAFWDHTRTHMKPDKILQCPKCPFVTEFKHHLEYHIRKHKNQKPFQCDKCSYTCVNKSMLNSHRKSHSSVYQYSCADCDYATKYCHSFKLHLRKYDHKPGMVLDEDGTPNPSLVIDVYGTRRGPKNKISASTGSSETTRSNKRSATTAAHDLKQASSLMGSQLSAALQGFPLSTPTQTLPPVASPAKSTASSCASDLQQITLNMTIQQQQQQQQTAAMAQQQQQQQQQLTNNPAANLLPPLASILQQNHNMAFFPYWNLNLQMLAAQQQAAVLAQLSPRMREQLQRERDNGGSSSNANSDDEEEEEHERKSFDSAMDLSQGTPTKEEQQQTPNGINATNANAATAMNLKLQEDDTPIISSSTSSRRKGRVLKLDTQQLKFAAQSPEQQKSQSTMTASSPIPMEQQKTNKIDDGCISSADEETSTVLPNGTANISASSTASSSGNSSNSSSNSNSSSSSSSTSSNTASSISSPTSNSETGTGTGTGNSAAVSGSNPSTMFECKYCDIYFKDAVLYTIHMGYHSCDDVFKCNMCGEKCDSPVGLFVHMARNAHS